MSCFAINTFEEDNTTITLDSAQQLLDIGRDALGLAPIPGLDVAAGALSSIIGMIKVCTKHSLLLTIAHISFSKREVTCKRENGLPIRYKI